MFYQFLQVEQGNGKKNKDISLEHETVHMDEDENDTPVQSTKQPFTGGSVVKETKRQKI